MSGGSECGEVWADIITYILHLSNTSHIIINKNPMTKKEVKKYLQLQRIWYTTLAFLVGAHFIHDWPNLYFIALIIAVIGFIFGIWGIKKYSKEYNKFMKEE